MEVIDKNKQKEFLGCIKSAKRRVIKFYNNILFMKYKNLPIDEHSIVLESEGDCCDNAYALFDYMKKTGYVGKYKIIWLVDHPENFSDELNVKFVKKNIYEKFSARTVKALRTCKWYIYDHCNLMAEHEKRDGQRISYLCHGYAGFKAAKGGTAFDFKADEEFTTGEIPVQGCIDWHGTNAKKYILGFSRLDYFYNYKEEYKVLSQQLISKDDFIKVLLWMPTFRQSFNKELSEDYFVNETGLPLFSTTKSIDDFNEFLKLINTKIVLKIHHLQAGLKIFTKSYSNIQFLKDEDVSNSGLQLYQFVPIFDALITDYSSISTDYFLLDKPIIYILDDIEEYKKSRGLYPENALDYMPGDHVYNIDKLKVAIERILNDEDVFRNQRNALISQFHTYQDGNASKRILDHLGITKD